VQSRFIQLRMFPARSKLTRMCLLDRSGDGWEAASLQGEVDNGGHPHPRDLGITARSSTSLQKVSGGYGICGA
jgi:hypothetical protein